MITQKCTTYVNSTRIAMYALSAGLIINDLETAIVYLDIHVYTYTCLQNKCELFTNQTFFSIFILQAMYTIQSF